MVIKKLEKNDFPKLYDFEQKEYIDFIVKEQTLGNRIIFGVIDKENLIGTASLIIKGSENYETNIPYINFVIIKEENRNQKIAQKLLKEIIKTSPILTIKVSEDNVIAKHIYSKLGFKEVKLDKEYYDGLYHNILTMIREKCNNENL